VCNPNFNGTQKESGQRHPWAAGTKTVPLPTAAQFEPVSRRVEMATGTASKSRKRHRLFGVATATGTDRKRTVGVISLCGASPVKPLALRGMSDKSLEGTWDRILSEAVRRRGRLAVAGDIVSLDKWSEIG
jgi:hypothetical protein